MIARGAESNPSCFLPLAPVDTTTVILPQLVRLSAHFALPLGNTKFLFNAFSPSPHPVPSPLSRSAANQLKQRVVAHKTIEGMARELGVEIPDEEEVANGGGWTEDEALGFVKEGIERRERERALGVMALGGEGERKLMEGHEAEVELAKEANEVTEVEQAAVVPEEAHVPEEQRASAQA